MTGTDDDEPTLKAPLGATSLSANGRFVSAKETAANAKLGRREVISVGAILAALGTGLGHYINVRDLIPPDPDTPSERAADLIRRLFPFFPQDCHRLSFHPNGDNKLLLDNKIGYGDSTIADHLCLHSEPLDCAVEPQTTSQPFIDADEHMIFSFMTLRQAHALRCALAARVFDEGTLLKRHASMRRSFRQTDGVHVVVGSPTGNRLSAYLRGKWRRTEPERNRELAHEGVAGLHLPLEFSLDRDEDADVLRPDGSYAWAVHHKDRSGGVIESYRPEPIRGVSDHFVISVIPNHLRSDMEEAPPVVLLEGGSSIGTSAFELLWSGENFGPLRDLLSQKEHARSPYWQAIFKVVGTGQRRNAIRKDEVYATDVQLEKFAEVHPNWTRLQRHRIRAARSVQQGLIDLRRSPR